MGNIEIKRLPVMNIHYRRNGNRYGVRISRNFTFDGNGVVFKSAEGGWHNFQNRDKALAFGESCKIGLGSDTVIHEIRQF